MSPRFAAPRAVLADEIHLYTHIHGAQVGMALRRLGSKSGEQRSRDAAAGRNRHECDNLRPR